MAKLRIQGDSTGYVDLEAPTNASSSTLDLDQVPQKNQSNTYTVTNNRFQTATGENSVYIETGDTNTAALRLVNSARHVRLGLQNTDDFVIRQVLPTARNQVTLTTDGYWLTPYQPSFMARLSSGNVTGTGDTLFNEVSHNVGSHYDSSNGRFTAPVNGTYVFTSNIMTNDAGGGSGHQYWEYRKNGSSLMRVYAYHDTANTHKSFPASITVQLNAGDYVTCYRVTNITWYGGNSYHTWFSGYLAG